MLKGYRTIIFNVVMTIAMVLALFNPDAELPDAEAVESAIDAVEAAVVALWAIGNMVLRAITNTPIFKPKPEV